MEWHNIAGLFSTIALISPVLMILALRLFRYPSYLALLIYCLSAFIYNLMTEKYLVMPFAFQRTFGIINNLLDAPLMLSFLMVFATSRKQLRIIKLFLGAFIVFELLVILLQGVTIPSLTVIMGPGLVIVFGFAITFFVENIKKSFIHPKFTGKAFLASGICFAYGCFVFLYIMYYLFIVPDSPYIFFVYFTITIIYCTLLSIGLVHESKRKRKLEELLHTRRELVKFFEEENKAPETSRSRSQWGLN